jgi:hypothetical protein
MTKAIRGSLVLSMAVAALLTMSTASGAAPRKCVMAGGEATMITRGLAEFMANAALKNSIKKMDATGVGAVALKCNDPAPLTYCIARQRACK